MPREVSDIFDGNQIFGAMERTLSPLARELKRRKYPFEQDRSGSIHSGQVLFPLMDILSKSRFYSASQLLDSLRAYKDAEECARIREACHRSDEAPQTGDGRRWPVGRPDRGRIFARLSYEMTALGTG